MLNLGTYKMYDLSFHDMIAQLCLRQFESLSKSGKPKENEWTTLACIILQDVNKYEVVALGTGTKCIGCNKMSKNGDVLNDSHAEVICRRAFLRYIYENMLVQNKCIFTYNPEKQIFAINKGINFHFFSTRVPCGDAAIFSKQDIEEFGNLLENDTLDTVQPETSKRTASAPDHHTKKRKIEKNAADIFRTGAKCLASDVNKDLRLEGANFHITGVVRTKPGRGVPTLSVSCSDKLAKWSHLGVQGALLSILLNGPIYFKSITIGGGTPYNKEAMMRALFYRLGDVNLHFPYYRTEIILGQASLKFPYENMLDKSPSPSSIVWLKGENVQRQTEVAVDGRRQGVTKKQLKTAGALQICKLELFKKFIEVIKQFEIKLENVDSLDKLTYKEAKLHSRDYQKYSSDLLKNFKIWTVKPGDLMDFCIS